MALNKAVRITAPASFSTLSEKKSSAPRNFWYARESLSSCSSRPFCALRIFCDARNNVFPVILFRSSSMRSIVTGEGPREGGLGCTAETLSRSASSLRSWAAAAFTPTTRRKPPLGLASSRRLLRNCSSSGHSTSMQYSPLLGGRILRRRYVNLRPEPQVVSKSFLKTFFRDFISSWVITTSRPLSPLGATAGDESESRKA